MTSECIQHFKQIVSSVVTPAESAGQPSRKDPFLEKFPVSSLTLSVDANVSQSARPHMKARK